MTKPGTEVEAKRAFTLTTKTEGVLPVTGGVMRTMELVEFTAAAVAAGAATVVVNHDKDDKVVGLYFAAEVPQA